MKYTGDVQIVVQIIPISELKKMDAYFSVKMHEASEALEKARTKYQELSEEYKLVAYDLRQSDTPDEDKLMRKRQLEILLSDAKCERKTALSSFKAYDEAEQAIDYILKYDQYQSL